MNNAYFDDEAFERKDFSEMPLPVGEYDHCDFIQCNFSGVDLSGTRFLSCTFSDCNLSMVKLAKTGLQDASFTGCKMLGLHFEDCDPFLFSVSFERSTLNHCSFYEMKMKKTRFIGCFLQEADFTGTDLGEAVLQQCDLLSAHFERTILEKADLRGSHGFTIDPENNRLRKAKFSADGLEGLLHKYQIEVS